MQKMIRFFLILLISAGILIPAYGIAAAPEGKDSGFIVVASAPAADFYTSIQTGSAPLRISFFDRSDGTLPLQYLWNFGDGTTSPERNPTHTYTANGKYTVTLTVKNSFGRIPKNFPTFIAVGDPPVPDFSATPPQGNIPLIVTFNDRTTGTPDSWDWDFGDGSSATVQNPTHTYTKPGIFSVTLFSGNEFGTGQITKSGMINTGVVPDSGVSLPKTVRVILRSRSDSMISQRAIPSHGHGISGMDRQAGKRPGAHLYKRRELYNHPSCCECIWE